MKDLNIIILSPAAERDIWPCKGLSSLCSYSHTFKTLLTWSYGCQAVSRISVNCKDKKIKLLSHSATKQSPFNFQYWLQVCLHFHHEHQIHSLNSSQIPPVFSNTSHSAYSPSEPETRTISSAGQPVSLAQLGTELLW